MGEPTQFRNFCKKWPAGVHNLGPLGYPLGMKLTLKRVCLAAAALLLTCSTGGLRAGQTEKIILVTTDGLRWEDLFRGADPTLMNKEHGKVGNIPELKREFWRDDLGERRKALMPFFWNVIAKQGQVFGNLDKKSPMTLKNGHNFSYPGYNEILSGVADPRINSNDKTNNPNLTVLEFINGQSAFKGSVAAFTAWDVFPFILNRDRSGLFVQSAFEPAKGRLNLSQKLLNRALAETTPAWDSVAFDSFIQLHALEYCHLNLPSVLYMAYGETDDWAHDGHYDRYLRSARRVDAYIEELWNLAQSADAYRGKTTLIISTDHGRGGGLKEWTSHGAKVAGSENVWLAVIGPDTKPLGERANTPPVYSSQIAATTAALLGLDFNAASPKAGAPIRDLLP